MKLSSDVFWALGISIIDFNLTLWHFVDEMHENILRKIPKDNFDDIRFSTSDLDPEKEVGQGSGSRGLGGSRI